MDERVLQFRVGVVVVASVIITSILVIFFQGKPDLWKRHYTIYLKFDAAPGVQIDTPVRKELIASTHTVDEIATYMRVDSLAYLSTEGLLRATGRPELYCSACFTGDYPVPFESDFTKEILDRRVDIPEVGTPGGR